MAAVGAAPAPGILRRYHFHAPGLLYVGVTLFLAIGAVNSQNNLLFAALGLAMGGLIVSGIISGMSLLGVRLEREPARAGAVGQKLILRYALRNANRLMPAFGLNIAEVAETGAGRRAVRWPEFFEPPRGFAVHVGPGETVRAEVAVWPKRRGEVTLDAVSIWSTFPFGLTKKSITIWQPQAVLIRPPILPLRSGLVERLTARSSAGLGGERSIGQGEEFFGLREYTPGDSPRRIAWRASARTGEIVVRQHALPSPVRLWIILRLAADADETADERAIALAASVLARASEAEIAVGLAVPLTGLLERPRTGHHHLDRLLAGLALLDLAAARSRDPAAAAETPSLAARGGAAVVIHAGAIDNAAGPAHARHLSGDLLPKYVPDTHAAGPMLAALGFGTARPAAEGPA
jgi:uncharacterized protein (DUF58 family)